jgi:hypothetical protein
MNVQPSHRPDALARAASGWMLTASALHSRARQSGAGYAIFWANIDGNLVVAGDYVTPARKAELADKGFDKSFAEESEGQVMPVRGFGPIASAYRKNESFFVSDVAASNFKRKDLALKYGIAQVAFTPMEGGVIEYGTSDGPSTANWCRPSSHEPATPQECRAQLAARGARRSSTCKPPAAYTCRTRARTPHGSTQHAASQHARTHAHRTARTAPDRTASSRRRETLPDCPVMPKSDMRKGFENLGASYGLFWQKKGDVFEVVADYTTESRRLALAKVSTPPQPRTQPHNPPHPQPAAAPRDAIGRAHAFPATHHWHAPLARRRSAGTTRPSLRSRAPTTSPSTATVPSPPLGAPVRRVSSTMSRR